MPFDFDFLFRQFPRSCAQKRALVRLQCGSVAMRAETNNARSEGGARSVWNNLEEFFLGKARHLHVACQSCNTASAVRTIDWKARCGWWTASGRGRGGSELPLNATRVGHVLW
jgi:hypothetical protein